MVVTVVFMIAPVNRRHFLLMKMVHARRLTRCNFTTTGAIIAILEAKTMRWIRWCDVVNSCAHAATILKQTLMFMMTKTPILKSDIMLCSQAHDRSHAMIELHTAFWSIHAKVLQLCLINFIATGLLIFQLVAFMARLAYRVRYVIVIWSTITLKEATTLVVRPSKSLSRLDIYFANTSPIYNWRCLPFYSRFNFQKRLARLYRVKVGTMLRIDITN